VFERCVPRRGDPDGHGHGEMVAMLAIKVEAGRVLDDSGDRTATRKT
jgi:hypothetical protein